MDDGWYGYDERAMSRGRRRAAAVTTALFATTIASGLAVDRLPVYRSALARWDTGTAFLCTLPTILMAVVTYLSGWRLRQLQSESIARYRPAEAGLERAARGEEPETIRWDRIDEIGPRAIITLAGGSLPFYPDLLADGPRLMGEIHAKVAAARGIGPDERSGWRLDGARLTGPGAAIDLAALPARPGGRLPEWPPGPRPAARDHALWARIWAEWLAAKDRPAGHR
jgi:hypothetical protein